MSRYSTSRQKSCRECSRAKAKCDLQPAGCSRCRNRRLKCEYIEKRQENIGTPVQVIDESVPTPKPNAVSQGYALPTNTNDLEGPLFLQSGFENPHSVKTSEDQPPPCLFLHKELTCPIDAEDIRNRWINTYVPVPGQIIKEYSNSINSFIYRILKSYTSLVVHGRGIPPFVHTSQETSLLRRRPLSEGLAQLRRQCNIYSSKSHAAVGIELHREMQTLVAFHKSGTYDDIGQLAAFQAFLICAMALFYQVSQRTDDSLRRAMMEMQEMACTTARRGLVCIAEQQGTRPRWEAWIAAEAKRRSLYVMYFFDGVLAAQDGLPTYVGTELQGLPAPNSRALWTASSRDVWEAAYDAHLAEWPSGGLRIDELWAVPAILDEDGIKERRARVDRWLEGVDEFGTMLYAVTSCTHGQ